MSSKQVIFKFSVSVFVYVVYIEKPEGFVTIPEVT